MANRNDQQARFNYLQSLYYQQNPKMRGAGGSTGLLPRTGGVPAGWMQMMGGVPDVGFNSGYVGAPDWMLGPQGGRSRNPAGRAAYNALKRQEARNPAFNPFDPQSYMGSGMPQYGGPMYAPSPNYAPYRQGKAEPTLQEKLAQSYLDQVTKANEANQKRYDEALGLAVGSRDRNMERIEQLGAQQASDIREDYDKAGKAAYADLVGRGLGGSTVTSAVAGNNLKEQTKSLNRLQDDVTRQRIDTDANLTRNIQDFIERRNDVAPDMNQLIALAEGLGRGNNGQGFGYIPQTQGVYSTGGNMLAYNDPQYGGLPSYQSTSTGGGMGNDMRTNPQFQPYQAPQQPMNQFAPGGGYGGGRSWQVGMANPYPHQGVRNPYGPQPIYGAYGGQRLNAQQLGARPTVDYAAAATYERSMNQPAPAPQQQTRYVPSGGGYQGFRAMPAPQFVGAGGMYSIPNASYGAQNIGPAYGFAGSRYMGVPDRLRNQRQPIGVGGGLF